MEHKVTISGVNGYSQRFDNSIAGVSTVVWNRLGGGWAVTPKSTSPKLAKIANERDALAASGLRQGVVFRSGEVHPASTADKLNLSGLLRGGVLIDLRKTGTKDPNLPGVTEARYAMTSTTNTSTFVTKQADRAALGKALTAIANSNGPVLIPATWAATGRAGSCRCCSWSAAWTLARSGRSTYGARTPA